MRRLTILAVVLAGVVAPAAVLAGSASAARTSGTPRVALVAFRGLHLGGGGLGRRGVGFGGSRRRGSSHLLRRVAHALAFAYLLHLFFSHGGLSILFWLLIIGLVVHLLRRRRSRGRRHAV